MKIQPDLCSLVFVLLTSCLAAIAEYSPTAPAEDNLNTVLKGDEDYRRIEDGGTAAAAN